MVAPSVPLKKYAVDICASMPQKTLGMTMLTYTFLYILKSCVRYFSLFLKKQCVSWLFQTKYFEIKFNLQLLYLPIVSREFILS